MVQPKVNTPDSRSSKGTFSSDRRAARELIKQDLSKVLPAIWEAESLEKSVQKALEAIRAEFGYALLWMGLYNRFEHNLTTRGFLTNGSRRFSHTSLALHPGDLLEQVIVQQRPTVIADIGEESRAGAWEKIAKAFELQGTVILPIQRKGVCFGLMVLGSRRWGVEPGILENSTLLAINHALAEAIHQNEQELERQQTKQPAQPLLSLLNTLSTLPGLDARLEVVADETQRFMGVPMSVYWLEPRGRHFWCRVGKSRGRANSEYLVSEMPLLYQSLCNDEMIVLGEAEGSLKAGVATRLMQHLNIQSLMVAPIIYQNELQGFITAEGARSRIWSDVEKHYLKGIAQLIGIAMPTSEMDTALSQVKSDHLLSAGITRSIHSDRDWQHVLGLCIEQLAARIGTDQLLVLNLNAEKGGFDLCYRTGVGMGRSEHWLPLDTVDEKMLKRAYSPVSVESLENDLKFAPWRSRLKTLGAKSLLVSSTSPGQTPEGLVIVIDKRERRWSQTERQLVQTLSNQIGLILHQWQLQRQTDQQAHLQESFQWGMQSLQRLSDLKTLDQSATRHISQILHTPLVALITWENGSAFAQASNVHTQNNSFQIDEAHQISVETDAIVNWAVSTEGLLTLKLEDLPNDGQQWLSGPEGSQLLVMALRTAPNHQTNAVIVLADVASRQWSDEQTSLLAVVVNQLAWCRRHLKLTTLLVTQQQQLTQLNWYKQHQIENLSQGFKDCMQQLSSQQDSLKNGAPRAATADAKQIMLLQRMETMVEQLSDVISNERWALATHSQTTPFISLLKRALARAQPLVQERQLWTKVHCESNLTIVGDIHKIEFVLYELIAEACDRSPVGDRIDIWCRPLDNHWLEVAITDDGVVDPEVLQELEQGRPSDLLSPSSLQQPNNSALWVCQSLMQQLGGEFTLSRMEDGRILSRVMLPLARSQ